MVPKISKQEMKQVDEEVPEKYGIDTNRLMENAGLRAAEFIRQKIEGRHITVYAGKGNNGGDALVVARRLHLWNYEVEIVLASRDLKGIQKEELDILDKLGVEINEESSENDYRIALDGLLGYGISGNPRPPYNSMIEEINAHETIVSVDIPTGLNPDTGEKMIDCIDPGFTVTLGLPFKGMNKENSGDIWVADIGIPSEVYSNPEKSSIFNQESLVQLQNN
jgi:hydroxyethylthiazole kinase-like uncharacterized protein yjeF